jgi:bifunctional N-acetylglucosamine-1-phosphate-uridyltransferase/glucosamine-1-phosphate-acetyltransferase GlmU-like protein
MNRPSAPHRVCAVVPAAGRGTRLGADAPKVFVPLRPGCTIWDRLHAKLAPLVEKTVLVLSPEGRAFAEKSGAFFERTTLALQPEPLGMGDAIFGAAGAWRGHDDLLIIWGDQANISSATLAACLNLHSSQSGPAVTLPVVRAAQPYVEFVFDQDRLTAVRQSREGDLCVPGGFSDVGTFILSAGHELEQEWQRYLARAPAGSVTREINFLPFLVHLSRAGWPVRRHEIADPLEAVGINTPEELALARRHLEKETPGESHA